MIFQLEGQEFYALNEGQQFKFTEAISFFVKCETQEEIDYYWEKLSEGGENQELAGLRINMDFHGKLSPLFWMKC